MWQRRGRWNWLVCAYALKPWLNLGVVAYACMSCVSQVYRHMLTEGLTMACRFSSTAVIRWLKQWRFFLRLKPLSNSCMSSYLECCWVVLPDEAPDSTDIEGGYGAVRESLKRAGLRPLDTSWGRQWACFSTRLRVGGWRHD